MISLTGKPIYFLAGIILTVVLFQFNVAIPSYDKSNIKALQNRINHAMIALKTQKQRLPKTQIIQTNDNDISNRISTTGVSILVNFSIKEYCKTQQTNIMLNDALSHQKQIPFDYGFCLSNTKNNTLILVHK